MLTGEYFKIRINVSSDLNKIKNALGVIYLRLRDSEYSYVLTLLSMNIFQSILNIIVNKTKLIPYKVDNALVSQKYHKQTNKGQILADDLFIRLPKNYFAKDWLNIYNNEDVYHNWSYATKQIICMDYFFSTTELEGKIIEYPFVTSASIMNTDDIPIMQVSAYSSEIHELCYRINKFNNILDYSYRGHIDISEDLRGSLFERLANNIIN